MFSESQMGTDNKIAGNRKDSTCRRRRQATTIALMLALCNGVVLAQDENREPMNVRNAAGSDNGMTFDSHVHGSDFVHLPSALGSDLGQAWGDVWPHTHFSRLGTPFVHAFNFEPAFLGRELLINYSWINGSEGAEYEADVELEYAFSRRIGIVIEAAYAWLEPDADPSENGFGDIAIAPRFLLVEEDSFLLSANFEFEIPTGDEDRDLGAGEYIFGPSLSGWFDLGNNVTLQGNIGLEHGLESDSDAVVWGLAVAYSIYTDGDPEVVSHDGSVRAHFPNGQLNLIAEIGGEHPLDGDEEGDGTAAWIFGASYSLSPNVDIRAGVTVPAWNPREFNSGVTAGLIIHF